jgi:hypothetical protein
MGVRRLVLGVLPLVCAVVVLFCLCGVAFGFGGGRVYELVSPVYKGGFGVLDIQAVAPDGEGVIFYSPGAFAGAPSGPEVFDYYARRGAAGWGTVPLMVPAGLAPDVVERDVSPSLGLTLAMGKPGASEEIATEGTQEGFWVHPTGSPDVLEGWEPVGGLLSETPSVPVGIEFKYEGASPDFCHVLFADVSTSLGASSLLPEAAGADLPLYEMDRGCGGEGASLRLVGVRNRLGVHGEPEELESACQPEVGISKYDVTMLSTFNAVADDGNGVFFTSCVGGLSGSYQLFVRLGGGRTVEVSRPFDVGQEFGGCVGGGVPGEVPCDGAATRPAADFVGASEDGSVVFFTTAAPLEPATDKDSRQDLYMARIGCPEGVVGCAVAEEGVTSLTQVSHSPVVGEAAEVQGAVRLAPNGERVYFVARGVLSEEANAEGVVAAKGADNLYVYDSVSGRTAFIAELCSGGQRSGSVEDLACPAGANASDSFLWNEYGGGEEQTAGPGGEYMVFSTYAQLVHGDNDSAKDVYRYDALTGSLERVSVGEDGYDANGNDSAYNALIASGAWGQTQVAHQYESGKRAVSEDGSRVVFRTAEPLSPQAGNGLANVYEWREVAGSSEGEVSIISSGGGEQPVEDAVISPSGRDIFFVTEQGLVPQDVDGAGDVYDARLDGGFPSEPVGAEPCSGEACLGPLSNPAPLLVPGSSVQTAGGNFTTPASKKAATKPKPKKKKTKKGKSKKKKGKARGSRAGRGGRGLRGRGSR